MEASSGPNTRSSLRRTLRRITVGGRRQALRRRTRAHSPSLAAEPPSLDHSLPSIISPDTMASPSVFSPMVNTSPITCKTDPECGPGDGLVAQQGPIESTEEVNATTLDIEEGEVEHMGFSEQLNSEPCDLRSPEGLTYPDECEATQETTMSPSLMDPETAIPTTEMTPPAEMLPDETLSAETLSAETLSAETLSAEMLSARTPPVETPMVDHVQSQAHSFISINRLDVQVVTGRGSTPCDEGWKKQVLHLLDRTHAIISSVLQ